MGNALYTSIAAASLVASFVSGAALTSAAEIIAERGVIEGQGRTLIIMPVNALDDINVKQL